MNGLTGAFQRWRHSHGYGVHSPYGYALVTRVVRPGNCAWYGYEAIDGTLRDHHDRKAVNEAKLLLRLLAMTRPLSVFIPKGSHPAFYTAVRSAGKRIVLEREPSKAPACLMIGTHDDFIPLEVLTEAILVPERCIAILNTPPGWADAIFNAMPEGVMFEGKRNTLIIHHPGMQKLRYPMKI